MKAGFSVMERRLLTGTFRLSAAKESVDCWQESGCRAVETSFPVLHGFEVNSELIGEVGLQQVKLKSATADAGADGVLLGWSRLSRPPTVWVRAS